MSTEPAYAVIHNEPQSRFECIVDGLLCVADYERHGAIMAMTHTVVPSALAGRGIAAALVAAALEHARAQGWRVDPVCSYVRVYMQRHPETLPLKA